METKRLAGLEPAAVFHYFEEICAIPHGSRNTKKISDYLVDFAKEHGLRYIQDAANNVILFGNGTCGMENHAPVILQGHMDMVCEKDMDCPLDMEKEGLDVTHDDKFVFAKGTTLGGDDGIAVAYALALLADDTIPHPPLEVIITVDEEIGMLGADVIDLSELKGRTMINLDSEDEGIFTVSCAGGATATISLPAERKAVYGPCVRLSVDGLQGGHSGAEIHKNRANANKVMGEFMDRIQKLMPLCLTSLSGGTKDNAIPRSCQATLVAMGIQLERINAVAEELQAEVREKYDEPDAVIQAFDVDALGVVSRGIDAYRESCDGALLIISHNTRILEHLKVDRVHVMVDGRIAAEGDASLLPWIDRNGFESFENASLCDPCRQAGHGLDARPARTPSASASSLPAETR